MVHLFQFIYWMFFSFALLGFNVFIWKSVIPQAVMSV